MSDLKPCPFCGGEAYTVNDGGRYWTVECHDCAAHTGLYATKDFAIGAWNARAERGTLTAEQVREAIEHHFGKVGVLDDGKPVEWRDDWVCKVAIDYRAIADELNTRAERTCKPTEEDCCPICGEDLVKCNVGVGEGGGAVELDPPIYHNYCPNCGAKVCGRMSGICDTCRRKPCPAEGEWLRRCDFHEGGETRYERLFGTPERAARTLAMACGECSEKFPCWECPLSPIIGCNVYEPEILEWLRGDAE